MSSPAPATSTPASPQPAAPAPPATLTQELLGGMLAAAIAAGCLLIPIAHFVIGPLGPAIGAFLVSSRMNTGWRGRVLIGLLTGVTEAGFVGTVFKVMVAFSRDGNGDVPDWLVSWTTPERFSMVVGSVWVYATTLALAGAVASAVMKNPAPKR